MKVLFIHHCSTPGGASKSLYNLLLHLPIAKDDIYIITPTGSVSSLYREITPNVYELSVNSLPSFLPSAAGIRFLFPRSLFGYLKNKRALGEIRTIITKINPDIIHVNDTAIVPVATMACKMGYPVVMHARTARGIKQGYFDRLVDKWIQENHIKLVCIGESVRNSFKYIDSCHIVYNPLSDKLETNSSSSDPTRIEPDDTMNCLFLSNFLEYKGIFETIEAARLLRGKKNVHFTIAGAAIRERAFYDSLFGRLLNWFNLYPDIEKRIRKTVRDNNLSNVTLLGHVDNIKQVISSAHVNLAPVWLNAPPRSVFETGVKGVPTILALTDRVDDVVEDNVSGLIIPPKNSKALADAIMRLRGDEEMRLKLGTAAQKNCYEKNNPQLSADLVFDIYRDILKQSERVVQNSAII